ncbi:MAG: ribosome silencing factor [Solirubrobacteraceae bacterium]|nr:ribosome silencing factor [Solirubrobacteraceae bacterium]
MTESESLQETTLDREAGASTPLREGSGEDARALALLIAKTADDMKAHDIVLIHVANAVGYADYFVVCNGNTDRQVKAIHDAVLKTVKDERRVIPKRVEGVSESRWILLDYLDVVLHVFTPDARDFYRLDRLYGDVPSEPYGTEPSRG